MFRGPWICSRRGVDPSLAVDWCYNSSRGAEYVFSAASISISAPCTDVSHPKSGSDVEKTNEHKLPQHPRMACVDLPREKHGKHFNHAWARNISAKT